MKLEIAMHPGNYLKCTFMEPLKITNQTLSNAINVTPATVSRLVNCKSNISLDMALRLSVAFGNSPEQWLTLQSNWEIENHSIDLSNIKKLK